MARLAELKLLEPETVSELLEAYTFCATSSTACNTWTTSKRKPCRPASRRASGGRQHGLCRLGWLLSALNRQRQRVNRHFQQVFLLPTEQHGGHPLASLWLDVGEAPEAVVERLASQGFQDAPAVAHQLSTLARSQRYLQLPAATRKRFDADAALIEVSAQCGNPDVTLARIINLMEAISRRAPYLALLAEYPQTLRRLVTLYSSSPWVSSYLTRHPILLDELLDARELYAEPDWPALAAQLEQQMAECGSDVEAKMDTLRHVQHASSSAWWRRTWPACGRWRPCLTSSRSWPT